MSPRGIVIGATLFLFSFVVSFWIGATVTGYSVAGLTNQVLHLDDEPYKPRYGMSRVFETPGEPLYVIGNESFSGWADDIGIPPFWVRINSHGLRDEDFSPNPPANTTRILVVGSSFTFGKGVNESQRFTEVAERRLNSSSGSTRIQIINAGIPGWGMREIYYFLKIRGLDYNPDIVVVSFAGAKISKKEESRITEEVQKGLNLSDELSLYERKHKLRTSLKEIKRKEAAQIIENRSTVENSSMSTFASKIVNLVREEDTDIIFYSLMRRPEVEKRFWRRWAEKKQLTFVRPPDNYLERRKEGGLRITPHDFHPDAEAHRLLGKRLYNILLQRIN